MKMSKITYLENHGLENTDETLKIAKDYAEKKGIRSIVVASTRGFTAEKACEIFKEYNLVVVTHVSSFREPNFQEFSSELRERLSGEGVHFVTAAHTFGGINNLVGGSIGEIVKKTLRIFCQGFKVCVEISAMAADAGLVRIDEDMLSIAGTGKGADTVLVIKPAISKQLFNMKVKKILVKPI
jgi:hypothetical protein